MTDAGRKDGEQKAVHQERQVVTVVIVPDAPTRVNTVMVTLEHTDVTDAAVKGPWWSICLAVVAIKPTFN